MGDLSKEGGAGSDALDLHQPEFRGSASFQLTRPCSFKELDGVIDKGNCGDFYLLEIQHEMQLGTTPLFWLGMCKRAPGGDPAECQLSKCSCKIRNHFQTPVSSSL